MTTPIKQRANFQSANNTPLHGSSRKAKNAPTDHHMTPSRLNRVNHPPKPPQPESVDPNGGDGEGIQVAIRMRPLNSKEHTHKKVWKVLSKYASVAQTTIEGKPLPERIAGRNFFTYDQTFDESSSTYQVYSAIAQPIVTTACTGRNGTIFAYGQTSSGKTYTMQGSGTIAEGSSENIQNGNGGIVHMAAHDIFAYIASCQDRAFVVRASFLEIYNEEVRDLLQDYTNSNKVLQIREDPRRGVFVQSKEMIATDSTSLLAVLWQGEKSRSFATTAMNERSSRSHTIFRITIESRSRIDDNDENENDDTSGAILVSTLNLVDLAGSESVRHTGATGDRQKEGGMINQSLLTLSRVIVALGTPNSAHVNFRDSKLTRILQPSLSGNARMAVVCCATPSELYLEETRSTLLFASRAKLVKTNAQVNEVLDDRSIIRRLQRELALAKSQQGHGSTQISGDVLEWERIAASAGHDATMANNKLKRLYTTILMNNNLDTQNANMILGMGEKDTMLSVQSNVEIHEVVQQPRTKRLRRRMSDGNLQQFLTSNMMSTPPQDRQILHPSSDPPMIKKAAVGSHIVNYISPSDELVMMRQAVLAKGHKAIQIKRQMDNVLKQLQGKDLDLVAANCSNDLLRSDRDEKSALCGKMMSEIEALKSELDARLVEKDAELEKVHSLISDHLKDHRVLEETVDSLQDAKAVAERNLISAIVEKDATVSAVREELESYREQLNHQVNVVNFELQQQLTKSENEKKTLTSALESTSQSLRVVSQEQAELASKNDEMQETLKNITSQYDATKIDLDTTNEALNNATRIIEQRNLTISSHESHQKVLEANSKALHVNVTALTADNANLLEEILQLKSQQNDAEVRYETLKKDDEVVQQEKSYVEDLLKVAEIKLDGFLVVLRNYETEMEGVHSQLALLTAAKAESDTLLSHQKSTCSDFESQLFAAIADRDAANIVSAQTKHMLDETNIKYDELCQSFENSTKENFTLEKANGELIHLNGNLERRLVETSQEDNHRLVHLQQALDNAERTESILTRKISDIMAAANHRIDVLAAILHRSEQDKNILTEESTCVRDLNIVLSSTIELLNGRISNTERAFSDRLCELTSARDEIVAKMEKKVEELSVVLKHSQMELEDALVDRDSINAELHSAKSSLQHSCDEIAKLTNKIETLKSEALINVGTMQRLSSEHDSALSDAVEMHTIQDMIRSNEQKVEVSDLHQKVYALETKCREYESSLESSNQLLEKMLNQISAIESESYTFLLPYEGVDDTENGLNVVDLSTSSLVPTLQTARVKLCRLLNAISLLRETFSNQSESISSLQEKVQQLEQNVHSDEVKYTKNVECLTSELKQTEIDIGNLNIVIDVLTAEKEHFQAKWSTIESCGLDVDALRDENKELKHLLASANTGIDEARAAHKETAKQLSEKIISLDQLLSQLEAKENEIQNLKEEYNERKNVDEMELLLNEKERLERLLEIEVTNRLHFETELKQRMSAEQRKLIQEAEQEMGRLRGELEYKTNALKRSEAEAYAAREMKDDLDDQCKRTLDRAIQLESQIAALESEANRFRRISSQQETAHEVEITTLKGRLSLANREKQENEVMICDLNEKVNTLQRKVEEHGRDLSMTREQWNEASNQKMKQKNHLLTNELQRSNKELENLKKTGEESVILLEKIKELELDNDKLRQKLKSYVDRCEKLESSKLTKDKLEAIKKLMADKAAVERELKTTKQEVELLKSMGTVQSSSTMEGSELTSLRFDKEALESQLRKFASQCQHLEDEKLRIIHTFKSSKMNIADESIEKAIVALCDKVASLEEECNSLATFKNKAFSYKVELTTMKQQNMELSSKIADLNRKVENLQWIESGQKNLISSLTDGKAKLQHDLDRSRQESDSMRNQLKYLEQENLQLMIDYKAAKQKIHGLKAELNQLRSQMTIATVAQVREVGKVTRLSSARKPPKTPNDKENLKGSANLDSDKKKMAAPIEASKEIRTKKGDRNKPISARLGDAFAASDENTQECKQS